MNCLLWLLLDVAAAEDDCPQITVSRKSLEWLLADWLKLKSEIGSVRGGS